MYVKLNYDLNRNKKKINKEKKLKVCLYKWK